MPLPKNIEAYSDVRGVLDALAQSGGGTYTLSTANQAVRWRMKANTLRKLHWDRGETTPWDDYEFILAGTTIIMRLKEVGQLTDLQSNPLAPIEPEDTKEILADIEALKRKLDLET